MAVFNQDFYSFHGLDEDTINQLSSRTLYNASKKISYIPELLHGEKLPPSTGAPPIIPPNGTTRYITIRENSTDWGTIILIVLILILLVLIIYWIWEYKKEKKEKKEREEKEWEGLRTESN